MKTKLLLFFTLFIGFQLQAQNRIQKGYRFATVPYTEMEKKKLFSEHDQSDLLLKIYDAVLTDELELFLDTSFLGNSLSWGQIPKIQHVVSPRTQEIIYSVERTDYLMHRFQSDIPLFDEKGEPITVMGTDGFEEYVYPEPIVSPLNAKHLFQFRILEEGVFNSKKNSWKYTVNSIGIDQFGSSGKIVWFHFKELKKSLKNWEDFPFLVELNAGKSVLTPYRQLGPNQPLNDDDFLIKRTSIKNITGNELLFKQTNCDANSSHFLDVIFSNISKSENGSFLNPKLCVDNKYWYYQFIADQFKEFTMLTYPRSEVNCPILVYSGVDSMFNNAYHSQYVYNRELTNETYYEVELFVHPSEVKEIHVEQVKQKMEDGTYSEFRIKSLAFSIDLEGENRILFSFNFNGLSKEYIDTDWYRFLINGNYIGEQYWQSTFERANLF